MPKSSLPCLDPSCPGRQLVHKIAHGRSKLWTRRVKECDVCLRHSMTLEQFLDCSGSLSRRQIFPLTTSIGQIMADLQIGFRNPDTGMICTGASVDWLPDGWRVISLHEGPRPRRAGKRSKVNRRPLAKA